MNIARITGELMEIIKVWCSRGSSQWFLSLVRDKQEGRYPFSVYCVIRELLCTFSSSTRPTVSKYVYTISIFSAPQLMITKFLYKFQYEFYGTK